MTDRRIAQRFSVHATLEEGKLGTLFWTQDEERGAPALLLLLAAATRSDDATLAAIVADQQPGPHVLATYAHGRCDEGAWLATDASGTIAEASTLEAVLKRRDRLELSHILRLAVALSRAVDALGTAAKQHLDIHPNRVWLASGALATGAPQLFGIGWWRLLPAYQSGAPAEAFYGNPEYLAAELCKGLPATATADVYGAATTLWAVAAGKPPFPSNQPLMALKRQAVEKPLRLDLVKPALAGVKDLQAIVADALDKEPTKRPAPAAWRTAVEGLAAQKAADVLQQTAPAPAVASVPAPAPAPAPAALDDAADSHATLQFSGPAVAAALAAAAQPAEPTPAAAPMDDATALASLPDAPADGDEDDEGAEGTGSRQGRRRERRERQTVAGIGIAAALAEANLADQKPGGAGLAGLTPRTTPTLEGLTRTPAAASGSAPSRPALSPLSPVAPAAGRGDSAPPKRPESSGGPRVIVNQPAKPASGAAVARTGRSLTAEIAEGAFFEEDPSASGAAVDLGDQSPPTPPKESLNRKALLAILGFAVLMLGVSTWMSQRPSAPETPPAEPAPAAEEPAVEAAADATTAAAPAPAAVTPVAAPIAPTPAAAPPVVVPAAVAPDAGATVAAAPVPAVAAAAVDAGATAAADVKVAVAPPLSPAEAARQTEVVRLVAEGNSALATKDPVTALAKAQDALKLNPGHAPAQLLKEQAQRGVEAAIVEAKAAEAKAVEAKAAEAKAAQPVRLDAVASREGKPANKREAQKAAAKRAQAQKAERAAAAKEAAAAKSKAARERAAAKKAEKEAAAKKAEKEVAKKVAPEPPPRPARPEARPVEKPAEESGSATQEASKFAALAQKASKAKLKVLYLQKAVKMDPGNAGYKAQLKAAEEQLKTEGP